MIRRALAALVLLAAPVGRPAAEAQQPTAFSRLIERLSEGPGFFQSDNLVSNETSYLHPLPVFRSLGLKGGAYIGVGPEQSFSYLAELEPDLAILIDIRRDNLLLHLLFKAMFGTARNRLEYLGLLYGRRLPAEPEMWTDLSLDVLLDYVDQRFYDVVLHAEQHAKLMATVESYGVPLSAEDRVTIRRFHDEFAQSGLDIRYATRHRPSFLNFPTNRQLYLETDPEGTQRSYLATEDRWRAVRQLHRQDRIVPVVGDLAGPRAVKAIGEYLREVKRTVSVFYLSNVEQYLFRGGVFPTFVENLRSLPVKPNSILIRSRFGRGYPMGGGSPPRFGSQQVQTVARFLELAAVADSVDYWTLLTDTAAVRVRRP